MTESPANIVRWCMAQMGLGTDPAKHKEWPIYVGTEPNQPDECMTLYDTAGRMQGRMNPTGEQVQHRGILVRLRASSHLRGMTKLMAVEKSLNEQVKDSPVNLNRVNYVVKSLMQQSPILSLGRTPETRELHLFTLNYTADISLASGT